MQIKAGDNVVVIAGSHKYKKDKKGNKILNTGKVIKVFPKSNRVLVEGVNIVKKNVRPKQANDKGGIKEFEAPINASNVAILDPKTEKPTRIFYKLIDGKKKRFTSKSKGQLDKWG